jgi:hypothetical protein
MPERGTPKGMKWELVKADPGDTVIDWPGMVNELQERNGLLIAALKDVADYLQILIRKKGNKNA